MTEVVYVIVGTSLLGNDLYWDGFWWARKLKSSKFYKTLSRSLEQKMTLIRENKRKESSININILPHLQKSITRKNEMRLMKNIRVEAVELLYLGERTEEDFGND